MNFKTPSCSTRMFFTSRKYIHLNGGTEPQLQAAGQKNVACL
jgi:hypothetical protein